jgi:hypothetical protein
MLGYHRRDRSNVVDPRVVEEIARYCRDHGATDVAVLEAPTVYDRFFAHRSVCHWFGLDPAPPVVEGSPGPFDPPLRLPSATTWSRLVARLGSPIYTYASRHGELFVPAMDTAAFPPSRPPGLPARAVRWSAQRTFGLHPPRRNRGG